MSAGVQAPQWEHQAPDRGWTGGAGHGAALPAAHPRVQGPLLQARSPAHAGFAGSEFNEGQGISLVV